ncbi:TPA: hypothetical protein IXN57_000441 [Enterococcus faecium]|uniref:hypothetical protein n=1 Tax=Enterococcus faecium TaxID=1352 RepID=UPI00032F78A3|nr:hypothetical protein [Enterococcus faecium]EOH45656.1 hypothetical protein SSI_01696 [Enterococcus faecium EnGen0191]HAQ3640951.1 hypothetical protein [Enterococcus faecium]HCU0013985.1 hypothetical protein [Enterococcus faecium]
MKKEIIITYEGSKTGMHIENANAGEMLIMLTEALSGVCDELGVPYEQAIEIARRMEKEGELWEGVVR